MSLSKTRFSILNTRADIPWSRLLVQAQFERLRMFSSDAWFFFDLDRIEPLNALKYAAHAANLVEQATGQDPSDGLISIISEARSELSGLTGEMAFLGYLKKFENLLRLGSILIEDLKKAIEIITGYFLLRF